MKSFILINSIFISSMVSAQNTATFSVNGNCGMCKRTIEAAALKSGASIANWDESTRVLTVKYKAKKTSEAEILKNVAYAGYDNEKYIAPDEAYNKLHGCCKYERSEVAQNSAKTGTTNSGTHKGENHASDHSSHTQQGTSGMEQVYEEYFQLKDALINSNGSGASKEGTEFMATLNAVKMDKLTKEQHDLFMKNLAEMKTDAGHITENKDVAHQREHFSSLSDNIFELMKSIKPSYPVYQDHCPMFNDGKGANWVSKEKPIKNPYYGSKMLTCGNIKETIK